MGSKKLSIFQSSMLITLMFSVLACFVLVCIVLGLFILRSSSFEFHLFFVLVCDFVVSLRRSACRTFDVMHYKLLYKRFPEM